jgi:hypothetical protein
MVNVLFPGLDADFRIGNDLRVIEDLLESLSTKMVSPQAMSQKCVVCNYAPTPADDALLTETDDANPAMYTLLSRLLGPATCHLYEEESVMAFSAPPAGVLTILDDGSFADPGMQPIMVVEVKDETIVDRRPGPSQACPRTCQDSRPSSFSVWTWVEAVCAGSPTGCEGPGGYQAIPGPGEPADASRQDSQAKHKLKMRDHEDQYCLHLEHTVVGRTLL